MTGFALIVGPAIGGFICQTLGWRWVFWINLPIGMVAIALVFARLRESFGPKAALDIPGLATIAGAALAHRVGPAPRQYFWDGPAAK